VTIPDDLPEPVQRLVRPRLALRTGSRGVTDPVVGVWGGSGVVPLPAELRPNVNPKYANEPENRIRHWISVDCRWLERNGFGVRGWFSVYAAPWDLVVVNDPTRTVPDGVVDGLPLFGQEEVSLPEDDVLSSHLSADEIRALEEADYAKEYFKLAGRGCPLVRRDLVAVLGGWHMSWADGPPDLPRLRALNERINRAGGADRRPQGEAFRCEPYRLLVWTLRDAEPWIEVWGDGAGELHAVRRIS
jgi:hypothetical protein